VAAVAWLILCLLPSCSKPEVKPPGPPKAATANTNSAVATPASTEYASVFEDLMPPKGRDPFFPNSHRRDPVPVVATARERTPAAFDLVLKGVVGTRSHRMAVINGATLELNEEASVRLPDGRHARLRCLEIGENYVVIKVEGELQPKRLELSKKEF
jgi:hypothetical protein